MDSVEDIITIISPHTIKANSAPKWLKVFFFPVYDANTGTQGINIPR